MKKINFDFKTNKYVKELVLLGVLAGIFSLMAILSPNRFLSIYNIRSMAFQIPEFGILTLSMMIVIITGGINLSNTATAALSAVVGGYLMFRLNNAGVNPALTISLSLITFLIIASVCGLLNGFIVAYVGVAPFLVTLGSMSLFEGVSLNITRGGAISGFPEAFFFFGNGNILGIPVPMIIFIIVIFVTYFLLERRPFGLSIVMLGSNSKATYFSGVNIKKRLMQVYVLSALLSGFAAIIMASRYNSAKDSYGSSYLLLSIAAAVLGGTDIVGGTGSVFGAVIAVVIIQVITSGLNIVGLNRYLTDVIIGSILIFVLGINFIRKRRVLAKVIG